jgi:hypothetical protein
MSEYEFELILDRLDLILYELQKLNCDHHEMKLSEITETQLHKTCADCGKAFIFSRVVT